MLRFGVRGVLETGSVLGGGIFAGDVFPQCTCYEKVLFRKSKIRCVPKQYVEKVLFYKYGEL